LIRLETLGKSAFYPRLIRYIRVPIKYSLQSWYAFTVIACRNDARVSSILKSESLRS